MHIALVALPWAERCRPCFSIAALAAYTRRFEPSWRVDCHYDYLLVAEKIGFDLYDEIARYCYELGEKLNIALLYPERREIVLEQFLVALAHRPEHRRGRPMLALTGDDLAGALGAHLASYEARLDELADRIAGYDAVGMTTSFGQLFANVALAQKLKSRNPGVKIILGGSSISSAVGPSLLAEYACIDYVIQGEGELPLLHLTRALAANKPDDAASLPSVVSRETQREHGESGAELTELDDLDELPIPDFEEYRQIADRLGMTWPLPIEGSRGCWWDRVKKTGDAKQTCYFCNLNIQWKGYREKSAARIANEMKLQSDRYQQREFFFLDNIIRHKGIDELATKIAENGEKYSIFYEMRANLSPHDLLLLGQAGVHHVQIGIEALSTALLKRMGKGTTAIKNLEAMRAVFELGIRHTGNLIIDFPGATQAEADETLRIASEHAIAYEALTFSSFHLGLDNTVYTLRGDFPIANVRNSDDHVRALPEGVGSRLRLLEQSFDVVGPRADWSSVQRFCLRWATIGAHPDDQRLLFYRMAGDRIRVMDYRGVLFKFFAEENIDVELPFLASLPRGRVFELRGIERDLYLYCMRSRSLDEIEQRLTTREQDRRSVRSALERWEQERLVFREGPRVLSLAVAEDRSHAAARIRAQHEADRRSSASQHESKRLQVVG